MIEGTSGSSPRMRGKRRDLIAHGLVCRLIPAYAGKTTRAVPCSPLSPAHPRVCGENLRTEVTRKAGAGSSPRMRGKPKQHRPVQHRRRLIPAYAGKTLLQATQRLAERAHPRVCGENNSEWNYTGNSWGSSPRMRGKPRLPGLVSFRRGLIPAYAGKTGGIWAGPNPKKAHPRVCGENALMLIAAQV